MIYNNEIFFLFSLHFLVLFIIQQTQYSSMPTIQKNTMNSSFLLLNGIQPQYIIIYGGGDDDDGYDYTINNSEWINKQTTFFILYNY